jgi:uncharacterized protein YjbI with pentapeptide repeats
MDEEHQVVQLLTRNGMPFINIYGLPGTGKTALIASVVRRHYAELGVDGILWGELGRLTPAEQLWEFLNTLTSPTAIAPERVDLLRKLFWNQVAREHLRLIIVLDNVATPQAATDLLPPDGEIPPGCRILIISLEELRLPYGRLPCLPVRTFDTDQTRRLFIEVLGEQVVDHYAEDLARMGQALGGLPHLVTMAALQLRSVNLRTDELHDEIAAYLQQTSLGDPGYGERLELALRHLTDSQLAILELTGIMGEGDWPAMLVAAACLRSQTDVTVDLDALVDRGIIMRLPSGRYNTNRLIRSYAQIRLFKQPVVRHHTTLYLLTRACLDIAEDCYMNALEQKEIFTSSVPVTDRVAVVQQVRRQLLPEIAHIRQALHWAEQYSNWRLIERFARLAWFELLDNLVVNTREVNGSLLLATLYQPVFWYAGPLVQVYGQSGVASQPLRFAHPGITDPLEISDAFAYTNHLQWPKLSRDVPHDHADATAPELNVNLIASRIIDGIISGYTLVETRWIGVAAEGLILYSVDLGGARWLSCTIRNSLLHDCNAHHAELHNVDLQQSILEKVQLRGARLTNIDLRGARLTQVDLRGAQLTNVDLRGASLDTVNLRGASLTAVRFDGATLNAVAIHRAQVQNSTWYGVTGLPESENIQIVNTISNQARERQVETREPQPPTRLCADEILAVPTRDFHQQDLRGITLSGQTLVVPPPDRPGFTEAKLDVAQLQEVVLLRAKMTKASLRAADLTRADLSGADLRMANLQAVLAEECDLRLADLRGASLRAARLRRVNLSRACLAQADLSGADLREADLSRADLSGTLLVGADLRDAKVDDVVLARAGNLSRTLLTVGGKVYRVHELRGVYREMEQGFNQLAFLRFAMCSGTFVQVGFAERDLFGAQLTGTFQDLGMQRSDLRHARLSNSFTRVCLCDSNLEQATLSGIFSQCGFQRAHMRGARLEGTWSRASFQHADLRDTDWTGASLVEVDLRGAQGVTNRQLQQALRLRGTILPEGQCFVSPQGLPGDRDDARQWGYDPDDPEAMQAFYREKCKNL